jgi:hypothetical protein
MKRNYKYLSAIALSGVLCLFMGLSASAQRPGSSGGSSSSSGGSHPSSGGGGGGGGGGSYRPAPSSSGSSGSYRPSGGSSTNSYRPSGSSYRPSVSTGNSPAGSYRPSINTQRVAVAPPRIYSQGIRPPSNRIGLGNVGRPATSSYRGYVAPGASNVVGTRGYVGQGGRASVGAGGRGYYPTGYFGAHNYYYYNRGYYGTYYAPRLGFAIGFLPYGYYPFYWNDLEFYYCDGLFYNFDNGQYTVVEPPVGAEVDKLPSNAQSIVINGEQYYEADGVYYEAITKDDGTVVYQVAGKDGELNTNQQGSDVQAPPQVGDVVSVLPDNCRKININGEKYYVSPDGYYFQEAKDQNGNKVYKVVGTPSDEPDNSQNDQ